MKKMMTVVGCAVLALGFSSISFAGKKESCVTIQSGELVSSSGDIIETGYDQWGYNYQARKFNGYYCDAYQDAAWCQDYADDKLAMKWNDAWLSNKDCDGDGLLDRHHGFDSYRGSGAWLTNHISGEYEDAEGKIQRWNEFVKIIAAPEHAIKDGDMWVEVDKKDDSVVIGQVIWGSFAIIMDVCNDTGDEYGCDAFSYKSPRPGLGNR